MCFWKWFKAILRTCKIKPFSASWGAPASRFSYHLSLRPWCHHASSYATDCRLEITFCCEVSFPETNARKASSCLGRNGLKPIRQRTSTNLSNSSVKIKRRGHYRPFFGVGAYNLKSISAVTEKIAVWPRETIWDSPYFAPPLRAPVARDHAQTKRPGVLPAVDLGFAEGRLTANWANVYLEVDLALSEGRLDAGALERLASVAGVIQLSST